MTKSPLLLLAFAWVALFSGCHSVSYQAQGRILFDIGYGKSDSSLDISSANQNDINMSMNKGIMHILSRGESKILRISSYGQTLAMWYDPSRGSAPLVLKSVQINDLAAAKELGRFAIQVQFADPALLAVDSRQMIYIADAGLIRRFDSSGTELQHVGQEGLGSMPFPGITAITVLENDELTVSCVSESGTEVYFFDRTGGFLNRLKLDDQNLPTPASLVQRYPESTGARIIVSMESEKPSLLSGKRSVIMKMNYYLEKSDSQSGVTLTIDPVGSWIIAVDAGTGEIIDSYALQSSVNDTGTDQQLISAKSSGIVCVRWASDGLGGEVFCYNQKGKIVGKRSFMAPDKSAELIALTVGDDRYLYIMARLPSTLRIYAWPLPAK